MLIAGSLGPLSDLSGPFGFDAAGCDFKVDRTAIDTTCV